MIASATVALAILLPWLIRNWVVTGNPFFPAFNHLLGQDNINLFEQILSLNQTGAYFVSIALIPWTIFVDQFKFDGLQFGIPTLLLFLPFAFICKDRRHLYLLSVIVILYLAGWLLIMPNYIRFLVPLFPILCAVAAMGVGIVADETRDAIWKRNIVLIIAIGLGVAQAGFLGATGIRRLPAALRITTPVEFLESRPFLYYSQYNACRWVSDRVSKNGSYLALLNSPTYYCSVFRAFPDLLPGDDKTIYKKAGRSPTPPQWLGDQLLKCNVRYVIVVNNLGADSEPRVFAKHRYDSLIQKVIPNISPVYRTPVAKVFEGSKVAKALLGLPPVLSTQPIFQKKGAPDKQGCVVTIAGMPNGKDEQD